MSKFTKLLNIKSEIKSVSEELVNELIGLDNLNTQMSLSNHIQKVKQIDKRVASETFKVLVLGEFSTGKSSFINTLIEDDVLPTDDLETTATINILKSGEKKEIEIQYWGKRDEVGNEIEEGLCERHPLDSGTLLRFTTSLDQESNSRAETIKFVTIYHDTHLCKDNVEIVDTPGLNTTIKYHEQMTLNYLENGHCALLIFKATQPFTKKELDYIKTYRKYLNKFFIVVNKVDLLKDDFNSELQKKSRKNKLQQIDVGDEVPIYPVSCLVANEKSYEEGGITKFLDDFKEFLASSEKNKHILIPLILQAKEISSSIIDNLVLFIGNVSISSDEFDAQIKEKLPALESLKRDIHETDEKLSNIGKLMLENIEGQLITAIKDFILKLRNYICNYPGDLDDFEDDLMDYLQKRQYEINQFLNDSFKSELIDLQEYMRRKTWLFEEKLNASVLQTKEIQVSPIVGVAPTKKGSESDDSSLVVVGALGVGTVVASILISPVLLLTPILGPWLIKIFQKRQRRQTLQGFSDFAVPEIESKLLLGIPSQMIKFKESFNKVKYEFLDGMKDKILAMEKTIEAIRLAQKQEIAKKEALKKQLHAKMESLNKINEKYSELQKSIMEL